MVRLVTSLACVGLLTLTACYSPNTMRPTATPDELAAEQAAQNAIVNRIKADGGTPKKWQNMKGARKRFETVGTRIEKAGAKVCKALGPDPERGCYYYFEMSSGDEINAYADGEKIIVSNGMMRFVENDDELAMVMAHEFAHNLLDHVGSTKMNALAGGAVGLVADILAAAGGVDTQGQFTKLGGNVGVLSYSSDFESEADYVGMYILANAGYDIRKVSQMWRRMSINNPDAIYMSTTHPSHPERFIVLNKTVTEIEYKRKHRLPLMPEFKTETANAQ